MTVRDVLLVMQIAICRAGDGFAGGAARAGAERDGELRARSAQHHAGGVNLASVGYSKGQIPQFNRRAIETLEAIAGVEAVGAVNNYPRIT